VQLSRGPSLVLTLLPSHYRATFDSPPPPRPHFSFHPLDPFHVIFLANRLIHSPQRRYLQRAVHREPRVIDNKLYKAIICNLNKSSYKRNSRWVFARVLINRFPPTNSNAEKSSLFMFLLSQFAPVQFAHASENLCIFVTSLLLLRSSKYNYFNTTTGDARARLQARNFFVPLWFCFKADAVQQFG